MKCAFRYLLFGALVFTGCETARDVAVSSFRVIDAPANYVRGHIGPRESTTTTTTTVQSDTVQGGRPVTVTLNATSPRRQPPTHPSPSPSRSRESAATQTKPRSSPSPTQRSASSQPTQFPTARPVPGKPGYVYSLDSNGGYVDVSGYKSGDKAKDPYTQKVFIVP